MPTIRIDKIDYQIPEPVMDVIHQTAMREKSLQARVTELETVNERLRQDRLDYSSVTTTEGMNASEWIWRTGKAERRVAKLEEFARDMAENWDCDDDAHKYGTRCRACAALEILNPE